MSVLDMRYCVRGTALVMSFRFFITSRRNERTLSLSLPNVVHPIRITCMRCTFFQVRSGIISRGVIVRRLMIIMPLSPRKTSTIPQGMQLTILRDLSQLSAKTKQCNCASVDTTTSFLADYRVQLCSDVTMECNDAISYMPQINKGRA